MRQVTHTYNVYKFDELTKEAQERALDYFRESEDFPFLEESMQYKLEQLLEQSKIRYDETPTVQYSLSWSQGDGAMFYGRVYWRQYTIDIEHSGRYYHYNSKTFDINLTNGNNISGKVYERVEQEFNELYVDICHELERYGYAEIDYILSEESIKELIDANEYEFTEDGRLA